jgi:F-type H+-transporting ATPase subunit a
MTVGHVLLKVLAGFVVALGFFGFVPLIVLVAITALELLVALLQAYIFTILCCIYLNDALHLH